MKKRKTGCISIGSQWRREEGGEVSNFLRGSSFRVTGEERRATDVSKFEEEHAISNQYERGVSDRAESDKAIKQSKLTQHARDRYLLPVRGRTTSTMISTLARGEESKEKDLRRAAGIRA